MNDRARCASHTAHDLLLGCILNASPFVKGARACRGAGVVRIRYSPSERPGRSDDGRDVYHTHAAGIP